MEFPATPTRGHQWPKLQARWRTHNTAGEKREI